MNVKFQREIHASCVNFKPSRPNCWSKTLNPPNQTVNLILWLRRPNYGLIASSPPFWQRLYPSSGDCSSGIANHKVLFHFFVCWKHLIPLFFQPAVRLLRLDHPPSDEDCRNASRHLPPLLGCPPQRDPRPGLQIIIIAITFIIITTIITTITIIITIIIIIITTTIIITNVIAVVLKIINITLTVVVLPYFLFYIFVVNSVFQH